MIAGVPDFEKHPNISWTGRSSGWTVGQEEDGQEDQGMDKGTAVTYFSNGLKKVLVQ